MFIKTKCNDIVGVHQNSQIYWEEYDFTKNYHSEKGVKIICDGVVLIRYTNIDSQRKNIKNAKDELSKIFEALKNKEETYKIS